MPNLEYQYTKSLTERRLGQIEKTLENQRLGKGLPPVPVPAYIEELTQSYEEMSEEIAALNSRLDNMDSAIKQNKAIKKYLDQTQ